MRSSRNAKGHRHQRHCPHRHEKREKPSKSHVHSKQSLQSSRRLMEKQRPRAYRPKDEHPVPGRRPNASKSFRNEHEDKRESKVIQKPRYLPSPGKYSSSKLALKNTPKGKAFNIVSDAIKYGLKAGVLKQRGRFFYLFGQNNGGSNTRTCKGCSKCRLIHKKSENLRSSNFALNKSRPKVSNKKQVLPKSGYKLRKCDSKRRY